MYQLHKILCGHLKFLQGLAFVKIAPNKSVFSNHATALPACQVRFFEKQPPLGGCQNDCWPNSRNRLAFFRSVLDAKKYLVQCPFRNTGCTAIREGKRKQPTYG
jgi:hypothetical protein